MQNHTTLKLLLAFSFGLIAVALTSIGLTSCSDSEEPATIPASQSFSGELETTIPGMPSFAAVTCTDSVEIRWDNAEQTKATVVLGAFDIKTGMSGYVYNIGEMTIAEVECQRESDGAISLTKSSFECQAGNFATTGSLEGRLKDNNLSLTIIYRPGSMPYDVKSVFTSQK